MENYSCSNRLLEQIDRYKLDFQTSKLSPESVLVPTPIVPCEFLRYRVHKPSVPTCVEMYARPESSLDRHDARCCTTKL